MTLSQIGPKTPWEKSPFCRKFLCWISATTGCRQPILFQKFFVLNLQNLDIHKGVNRWSCKSFYRQQPVLLWKERVQNVKTKSPLSKHRVVKIFLSRHLNCRQFWLIKTVTIWFSNQNFDIFEFLVISTL